MTWNEIAQKRTFFKIWKNHKETTSTQPNKFLEIPEIPETPFFSEISEFPFLLLKFLEIPKNSQKNPGIPRNSWNS
jgi:hypothetical protein